MNEWTVIGVWIGDEPVSVGVIEGVHQVTGGDTNEFPEGCWAIAVGAPDSSSAEALGIAGMRRNDGQLDDDETGQETPQSCDR